MRHVKRMAVEEREAKPTTQMQKDELLSLLTDSEREAARRLQSNTTAPPYAHLGAEAASEFEGETVMVAAQAKAAAADAVEDDAEDPEAFKIDTRELDARVFQKHALTVGNQKASGAFLAVGTAPNLPQPKPEVAPDPAVEAVAPPEPAPIAQPALAEASSLETKPLPAEVEIEVVSPPAMATPTKADPAVEATELVRPPVRQPMPWFIAAGVMLLVSGGTVLLYMMITG